MKCYRITQFQRGDKTLCHYSILAVAAIVVCLVAAGPSRAQNSRVFTEWTVPTANSEPLLVLPVSDDAVYFTERVAGKIGKLNIESNTITEWTLPQTPQTLTNIADAQPHELIQVGNRIFFAEQRGFFVLTGAIGALNPSTGQLTEWNIASTGFPFVNHLLQAGKNIYFTEGFSDRIGSLNPSTNSLREWVLPLGVGFNLNGLDADADGDNLWFIETIGPSANHRIAKLNVPTNTLTEWTLPISTTLLNHNYVQEGFVYLTDYSGNSILRLDPATNIIKVWTDPSSPPSPAPGVAGLSLTELGERTKEANEPVKVYFGEGSGNNIGRFVTTASPSTDYPAAPVTTILTPTDTVATVATSTPPKTVAHVAPVTTVVDSVVNGSFTFWPIPTPNAGFGDFAKFEEGSLLFAERVGNKIALFAKPNKGDD